MKRMRVTTELAELIASLHPSLKRKLKASFRILIDDPHAGKALKEEQSGLWSFRVGRLRIIYRLGKRGDLEVVAIGPRTRIYEETFRLIQRDQKR